MEKRPNNPDTTSTSAGEQQENPAAAWVVEDDVQGSPAERVDAISPDSGQAERGRRAGIMDKVAGFFQRMSERASGVADRAQQSHENRIELQNKAKEALRSVGNKTLDVVTLPIGLGVMAGRTIDNNVVQPAVGTAKEAAGVAKERVADTMQSVKDRVQEARDAHSAKVAEREAQREEAARQAEALQQQRIEEARVAREQKAAAAQARREARRAKWDALKSRVSGTVNAAREGVQNIANTARNEGRTVVDAWKGQGPETPVAA
jgi:hypothetical protein